MSEAVSGLLGDAGPAIPGPPPGREAQRPDHRLPPGQWVRHNLFDGVANSVLTVVFGVLLLWVAYRLARFVLVSAEWEVVRRNLRLFLVGRFPSDQLWRLWAAGGLLVVAVGFSFGAAAERTVAARPELPPPERRPARVLIGGVHRFWPLLLGVAVLLSLTRTVGPTLLVAGGVVALVLARFAGPPAAARLGRWWWLVPASLAIASFQVITARGGVGWDDWGGLMLTVFVTVAGIVLAFPAGLVLALGRRSRLPVIRWLSIAYIELFRGVPLITLLFLGQFVIFFMFPSYLAPPGLLVRALIAIVLFESAYVAEVVRGGLQAVSKGQYEAAQALGLSPFAMMRRIVLPQALRAVIPALVGQFISLFKDTSLLSIIGILELLRVASAVVTQPDFLGQGLDAVTLSFAGFLYWVGCYTMSKESRRIERRVGEARR